MGSTSEARWQHFTCKVCGERKHRDAMRRTERGRTISHCLDCAGRYRCIHCREVKPADTFKTHSGRRKFAFSDGEPIRIAVCYACDYRLNKERYARYDRRVRATETLRAIWLGNFQRWRDKTDAIGEAFNLTYDWLLALWEQQQGCCYYTGGPITLSRGMGQWSSASLDRTDPRRGYVRGNVVWTTRLVNTSKHNRTADEFVEFCRQVVAHSEAALSASSAKTSA